MDKINLKWIIYALLGVFVLRVSGIISSFWFGMGIAGLIVIFALIQELPAYKGWITALFALWILFYLALPFFSESFNKKAPEIYEASRHLAQYERILTAVQIDPDGEQAKIVGIAFCKEREKLQTKIYIDKINALLKVEEKSNKITPLSDNTENVLHGAEKIKTNKQNCDEIVIKAFLLREKENSENLTHKAEKFLEQKNDKLTDAQKIDINNKITSLKNSAGKTNVEDIKEDAENLSFALKSAGAELKDIKEVGGLEETQRQISGKFSSIWDNLDAKTIFCIIVILIIAGNFAAAIFKDTGPRYKGAITNSVVIFVFALLIYHFIWGNLGRELKEKSQGVQIPQVFSGAGKFEENWQTKTILLPEDGSSINVRDMFGPCDAFDLRKNHGNYRFKDTNGDDRFYTEILTKKGVSPVEIYRVPGKNSGDTNFIVWLKRKRDIKGCE